MGALYGARSEVKRKGRAVQPRMATTPLTRAPRLDGQIFWVRKIYAHFQHRATSLTRPPRYPGRRAPVCGTKLDFRPLKDDHLKNIIILDFVG